MTSNIKDVMEAINNSESIILIPHIKPDGDCLGSAFALYNGLLSTGKKVIVVLEEKIPKLYSFLPGKYILMNDFNCEDTCDLAISIDSSDETRIDKRMCIFSNANRNINIDHHVTNTLYADINYIDDEASATGEIMYELLSTMGIAMTKEIATNLYVAISTDTGRFMYSNTTCKTHQIISQLLKIDFDAANINKKVFDTASKAKIELTKIAINNLSFYYNGKIAVTHIPYNTFSNSDFTYEDADGISSLPRSIEDVEIGILFTQVDKGEIKVSFRSNEYADVSKIALIFGGGGHMRASGCTIKDELHTAIEKVLTVAKKYI